MHEETTLGPSQQSGIRPDLESSQGMHAPSNFGGGFGSFLNLHPLGGYLLRFRLSEPSASPSASLPMNRSSIRYAARAGWLLVPAILATLTSFSPAEAQGPRPSPYRFIEGKHEPSIFVAQVGERRGTVNLGPGGGTLFGALYSIELSGPFAFEAAGFLLSTDRDVRVPTANRTDLESLGTAETLVGGFETRLRFTLTGPRTWNHLAPFVIMGGGVAGNLVGRGDLEVDIPNELRARFGPTFMGVAGGGVRWFVTDELVLRGEYTGRLWKMGTPSGFFGLPEDVVGPLPTQEWIQVPSATIGVSWRF